MLRVFPRSWKYIYIYMAACHLMFLLRLRPTGQSFHTPGEQSFHTPLAAKFPYLYRVKVSIPLLCHFFCCPAPDTTAWLPMPTRSGGESVVSWGARFLIKKSSPCHGPTFCKGPGRPVLFPKWLFYVDGSTPFGESRRFACTGAVFMQAAGLPFPKRVK